MNSETLYCTKKGTIAIPTSSESFVQIWNVCYVSKASANLISMGILKRCEWLYLNEGNHMLLTKETFTKETVTIKAKLTKQNIYHLVVYRVKEVIMSLHGQSRPTHLMGTTPTQHLWHRRFRHASHARIKLASTMVNGLLLNQTNGTNNQSMNELNKPHLNQPNELYETVNQQISDNEHLSPNRSEQSSLDTEVNLAENLKDTNNTSTEQLAALQANEDLMKVCQLCVQSKQTRIIQHTSIRTMKRILEQLHSDL